MAPGSERGAAGLTPKRLDRLGMTMLAIADQGVELRISVAEVLALLIGTGEAFSVDPFGSSSPAFHLAPGVHRRRSRSHNRRVGAREATGGAIVWGARLEQTVKRAALGRAF